MTQDLEGAWVEEVDQERILCVCLVCICTGACVSPACVNVGID